MDLNDQLLFQRQSARLSELELWLSLLLVEHGEQTATGWHLTYTGERVAHLRSLMPRAELTVNVEYDIQRDWFVLDTV
jgi:hypothetical protein